MGRQDDLEHFYHLVTEMERKLGGAPLLEDIGRLALPQRGVYFFYEPGQFRQNATTPRVVRVGTHGLRRGSRSTLGGRLRQHRGTGSGDRLGGNHRGSVFRLHVGAALLDRGDVPAVGGETWGRRSSAPREVRQRERPLEAMVSRVLRAMPVLWVDIPDQPGPASLRGQIEANTIALLSNRRRPPLDPPTSDWLGHHARAELVRTSGLWNVRHVDDDYDPGFLEQLDQAVAHT